MNLSTTSTPFLAGVLTGHSLINIITLGYNMPEPFKYAGERKSSSITRTVSLFAFSVPVLLRTFSKIYMHAIWINETEFPVGTDYINEIGRIIK